MLQVKRAWRVITGATADGCKTVASVRIVFPAVARGGLLQSKQPAFGHFMTRVKEKHLKKKNVKVHVGILNI